MQTTKYTFWKLINEYKIEIPIIQRDYAQGRNEKNIPQIRKDFLSSLHNAINNEDSNLDFDFIYGSIEQSDHTKTLIPLDGQQRLTTLFLLHWYLAIKDGCAEEIKNILSRFSYKTRISSRDFCKSLVERGGDFTRIDFEPEKTKISELIKDSSWFYLSWEKDPTVKSMLVMLDDIHKVFQNTTGGFGKLRRDENSSSPVTFRFLELVNFGLNDNLYVRMNARGKSLTDFENFKAKFNQILEESYSARKALDFSSKIDNEWTDVFWKYKDKSNTIDTLFMRYFYFITEMLYVQSPYNTETTNPFVYTDGVPKVNYELIKIVYQSRESIEFLFDSLNFWTKLQKAPDELMAEIFADKYTEGKVVIFDGKSDLWSRCIYADTFGIAERIILFSLIKRCICLNEYGVTVDLVEFIRVVRNLLTRVRQASKTRYISNLRFETMKRQLADICDLFVKKDNVYKILASPDFTMTGFAYDASSSEIEKAKLIIENPAIKRRIQKLEDNGLFRGCIDNVIEILKENPGIDLDAEVQNIWDCDNGLIVQALLTAGDYSVLIGDSALGIRKYLGNVNEWNLILTRTGSETKQIRKALKHVIEKCRLTRGTETKDKLEAIIKDYLHKARRDWRYYFIKYRAIVLGNNIFTWRNECEIRKLNGISLLGYHINPYVLALSTLIGNRNICDVGECYGIYGDVSPLRLKNGVTLESRKEGWKVKFPAGYILKKNSKQLADLETIAKNEFWLKETASEDRVEVAVRFVNSIMRK